MRTDFILTNIKLMNLINCLFSPENINIYRKLTFWSFLLWDNNSEHQKRMKGLIITQRTSAGLTAGNGRLFTSHHTWAELPADSPQPSFQSQKHQDRQPWWGHRWRSVGEVVLVVMEASELNICIICLLGRSTETVRQMQSSQSNHLNPWWTCQPDGH